MYVYDLFDGDGKFVERRCSEIELAVGFGAIGELSQMVFVEEVAQTTPLKTQFSSLDFLDRFTQAEQLSVVQATMVSAEVKLWYDRLLAADFVDLEDPRTEAGVDALIMAGLLDPSRKLEILTP